MSSNRVRTVLVALLLIVVLIGAQAVAYSFTARPAISLTGSLGQTGFAFLGGLRTFAAAVIWNRIDPQHHEYFDDVALTEQTFVVPKMRLVTMLDPGFVDAYYISSWIVFKKVGQKQGISVAREGLGDNPDSGILRANLLQLLFVQDKVTNRAEILRYAKATIDPAATWQDAEEKYEGYGIAASVLESLGDEQTAQAIRAQLDLWRSEGVGLGDHDHDGDGKQDH